MPRLPFIFLLTALSFTVVAEPAPSGETSGDEAETRTLIWPDGTRYVGGVKDGKRSGKGTIFWEDGTRFVGNFKNDLREGPGTMILPDGTVYNGYFSNDKLVQAPAETAAPEAEIAAADIEEMSESPAPAVSTEPSPAPEQVAAASAPAQMPPPQPEIPGEIEEVPVTEITDAVKQELTSMIDLWAAAWSEQNVPQYLDYYAEDFDVPGRQSRAAWEGLRRSRLSRPGFIDLDLTYERFEIIRPGVAEVTFNQVYRSDVYSDETTKTLTLTKEGPFWRILKEETRQER